jgi:ABC-2 type transport system permease protein
MTTPVITPSTRAQAPARPVSGLARCFYAEWIKLTRPRMIAGTLLALTVIAVGGTAIGIATADDIAPGGQVRAPGQPITIAALEQAGGGTALFSQTMGFMQAFLLAVLVGAVAAEFTRGTFRTMLLQQPARARVFGGKIAAIVTFMTAAVLLGEIMSWLTTLAMAPSQGIDTARWMTIDGLQAGIEDFGRAIAYVVGTAVLASMVGILARSIPIGVGIALVWAGPIENIIGDSWEPGPKVFPGLLMRAVINPGSTPVSTGQALVTLGGYCIVAALVAVVALRRRDVTS